MESSRLNSPQRMWCPAQEKHIGSVVCRVQVAFEYSAYSLQKGFTRMATIHMKYVSQVQMSERMNSPITY